MAHAVAIHSREQYLHAMRVLDKLPGTWQGVGPASDPVLLLTDAQYRALVQAGVIAPSEAQGEGDREVDHRGKKATAKKAKS